MKKIILGLFLIFLSVAAFPQQGLDGIIVEKYYVANAADHAADPNLPVGAVTYRIFVDMKDGWQLQSVYANATRNQDMKFSTTSSSFYNAAPSYGSDISYSSYTTGTTILDSYITLGAAAKKSGANYYHGIPKADDDGLNQIAFPAGLIENTAGVTIPPRVKDGVITVTTPPTVATSNITAAGIDDLLTMLDEGGTGNNADIHDGLWATTVNCVGPNSDNKVLIAQFTTDGVFTYKFNIQIRRLSDFLVENYVNANPSPIEYLRTDLSGTVGMPPTPPTVSNLTVTPNPVIVGEDVNLSVEATDNVSISKVEFFRGSTSLGVSTSSSSPYLLIWTSNAVGTFNITAVATDDEGTTATSSAVSLVVNPVPANQLPVVDVLTVPSTVNINTAFNGSATAHDPDGTIQSVQFYVNDVAVGPADNSAPYEFTYTAPASEQILTVKAVATDNRGGLSAAKTATVTVTDPAGPPYQVLNQVVSCVGSDLFYVPVITRPGAAPVANIIGFDLVMKYEAAKVRPTGLIRVDRSLIADSTWTSYALRQAGDSLIISLFLNSKAPENTFFAGTGNVLRVEFTKTPAFLPNDAVTFTVRDFVESYNTGIMPKQVKPGTFTTFAEDKFNGKLIYWADASPIYYSGDPATSLITNIFGNVNPGIKVQPDMNGEFVYDIDNGLLLSIDRNIDDAADVMSVINGYDAFLAQKVVLEDPSFRPNVFQIMAMDVNRDTKISAGDVSQILQRATKKIGEFRQAWNYNDNGTKKPGMGASYDWVFADNSGLYGDPRRFGVYAYESVKISTTYPKDDGKGYSKFRATIWPASNLALPVEGTVCPIIYSEVYQGVMYGDVDGSYKNLGFNEKPSLKKGSPESETGKPASDSKAGNATSGYTVTFDLSKSSYSNGYLTFPVSVNGPAAINSLDFAVKFDESKLKFNSIVTHLSGMQSEAYYDATDKTLRFSSFNMQKYDTERPVASVRFEVKNRQLANEDINAVAAYLNGNKANAEKPEMVIVEQTEKVQLFPNPARDVVNVVLADNAEIALLDMLGRTIRTYNNINAFERYEINLAGLAQGTYFLRITMKVGQDDFVAIKKLVVKK